MIEIGEYVRTFDGNIMKINKINSSVLIEGVKNDGSITNLLEEEIKSHSKNIIDIIEPSDLVNGLIVQSVHHFPDGKNSLIWVNDEFYTTEDNIRTILTHEQYEQNCYRLEE